VATIVAAALHLFLNSSGTHLVTAISVVILPVSFNISACVPFQACTVNTLDHSARPFVRCCCLLVVVVVVGAC
jgi:hypothetical protein